MNELNSNGNSFIIVTWNNENEIFNCIDSIQKIYGTSCRVIVVDNCSKDKTVNIVRNNFKWVDVIVSDTNLGFAAANNVALEKVVSDYVCFLNPDVILTEDIIKPSIESLSKDDCVGVVACRLKNVDGTNQQSWFSYVNKWSLMSEILHIGKIVPSFLRKKYFLNYYVPRGDFYPDWVIGAEMVMRTNDAKQIQGFSTEYFMYTEDMDLCMKVKRQLKKKILVLMNISLIHLGGASEGQNISYNKQEKLIRNDAYFVKKFYGNSKSKSTIVLAYKATMIRLWLLLIGYWKCDRDVQLNKTKHLIDIFKKILRDNLF